MITRTRITHTEHLQTTQEAEARRIAAEEWQRKLAQSQREEAEQKERSAKDQEQRHVANQRANRILLDFMTTIKAMRPTRESLLFGPQLEAIIERGIEDMAAYFHDHLRDHYDARKDV